MLERKENIILVKIDKFSDRIIKLHKYLTEVNERGRRNRILVEKTL